VGRSEARPLSSTDEESDLASDFETSAWIVMVMGLYAAAAGVGELRVPGFWASMVDDLARSPAARFLTGLICMVVGGALYLVGSWDTAGWMVVLIKVIGGWMVLEGALILALGDWVMGLARRLMTAAPRLWALLSLLLGLGLIAAAIIRF
jgi:hypothetical protein